MSKFFIGGYGTCGVHNERHFVQNILEYTGNMITANIDEADHIILLDTCIGNYRNLTKGIEIIGNLLDHKKESTTVILSGCLSRGVKFPLSKRQQDILSKVTIVEPEKLFPYLLDMSGIQYTEKDCDFIPITFNPFTMHLSPVTGCLNRCAFCKSQYMNFDLKSHPFEQITDIAERIKNKNLPAYNMIIHSSNLSLYGVDLYGHPRAHEVIRTLTSPPQVKFSYVGAIINIYEDLIREIIENPKVKHISISLESGSPRIYKLMNRPIPLEVLIEIIKRIRKERPDIVIHTELIAGFPTENEDDIKRTIELVHELDVLPDNVFPYQNSPHIVAASLPQSSLEHRKDVKKRLIASLRDLREKYQEKIRDGEQVVLSHVDTKLQIMDTMSNIRIVSGKNFDDYGVGDTIPPGIIKPKMMKLEQKNSS